MKIKLQVRCYIDVPGTNTSPSEHFLKDNEISFELEEGDRLIVDFGELETEKSKLLKSGWKQLSEKPSWV
jgi:hypothetical protein